MLRNDDEIGVVTLAREWEIALRGFRARHLDSGDIENGLQFPKHPLMQIEGHPFDTVAWITAPIDIKDEAGKVIFADNVEFPETWGERDKQVVASKYFFGDHGQGFRETSLKQMLTRVSCTIAGWALENGTFRSPADAENFLNYLIMIQLHQEFAFNSPVYFNVGVHCYGLDPSPENYIWDEESQGVIPCPDANKHPQISACFIQSVDDDMSSIMRLATSEAMLFKRGSGTGSDLSTLRSSKERLSCGGTASGPVSFMAMYDRIAAIVKSGGRARRAAKMQTLKYWHPDIWQFVECKPQMERMARDLIAAGYPRDFNGPVYSTVLYQNANLSVRVDDAFMQAARAGGTFDTRAVTTGDIVDTYPAAKLLDAIAFGSHDCGDPAVQFEDTMQRWHTVPNHGPINSTNPCGEYVHIDNSACNLASINLLRFLDTSRQGQPIWNQDHLFNTCRVAATAMETMVGRASYPTPEITLNSHRFRPLGGGYCNLGALLMVRGLPYDSPAGRLLGAALASLITGTFYLTSADLARLFGAFDGHAANADAMMNVIEMHRQNFIDQRREFESANGITADDRNLFEFIQSVWRNAIFVGRSSGYRNSQCSCIAPTGTIGFMMGCDTLGIEPETALVRYKSLAGGGILKLVNMCVPEALRGLGYDPADIAGIAKHMSTYGTIEDVILDGVGPDEIQIASGLKPEHLPVFDCAFPPAPGEVDGRKFRPRQGRSIAPAGHVRMMGQATGCVSGAISKCVTGDTIIVTDQGLIRIGSLYANEEPDTFRAVTLSVPTASSGSLSASVPAAEFYYGGYRPVFQVTLSDGRTIRGTDRHRLRVARPGGLDWEYLTDLQPGDFVAIHRGTEMWGEACPPQVEISPYYGCQNAFKAPVESSFELGLFLGMLTADGHVVQSNYVVGITKNSDQVLCMFKNLLSDLFGLEGREIVDERNGVRGMIIGSKSLVEWLRGIGFSKQHIPEFLLRSPRSALIGYLSGIYLDGYITKSCDMAVSQKYKSLLIDVQSVWDNLGVATYFTSNVVKGKDYPVLHILACHRGKAAGLLTWLELHKADRAADLSDCKDRRPFPMYRDKLMESVRSRARTSEFRSIFDPRTAFLTRQTFLAVAAECGVEITIEEKTLDYLQVTSVDYAGEEQVYDLSVPSTESFVGNGIVNHNTVNMPSCSTVEDIKQIYFDAWRLGCKSISVYRDGSKGDQPVSTSAPVGSRPVAAIIPASVDPLGFPARFRMPDDRPATIHKFNIMGHEGFITVGFTPDGQPGEVFIEVAKQGSTVGGLMGVIGTLISVLLQHYVPMSKIVEKLAGQNFEPRGITKNIDIRFCKSIVDYVGQYLGIHFVPGFQAGKDPVRGDGATPAASSGPDALEGSLPTPLSGYAANLNGSICCACGEIMVRVGQNCEICSCGHTNGGCGG